MNLIRGRNKRVSAGISELIPIKSYDDMLGAFVMKHGYMDIYGIRTYNMDALSPYEQDYIIMQRLRFQQNYDGELKMVSIVFPVDLTEQRMFLVRKYDSTEDPLVREIIEEKLRELERLEDKTIERDYYYMIFAENEEEMHKDQVRIESLLQNDVVRLRKDKKIDIVRQLCNQSTLAYRRS